MQEVVAADRLLCGARHGVHLLLLTETEQRRVLLLLLPLVLWLGAAFGSVLFRAGLCLAFFARDARHNVWERVVDDLDAQQLGRVDGPVWLRGGELDFGERKHVVDGRTSDASKNGMFVLQLGRGIERDLGERTARTKNCESLEFRVPALAMATRPRRLKRRRWCSSSANGSP